MSARNGDRARFHKDRKRKLQLRARVRALVTSRLQEAAAKRDVAPPVAPRA